LQQIAAASHATNATKIKRKKKTWEHTLQGKQKSSTEGLAGPQLSIALASRNVGVQR
jgi:hypothetical protein